MYNIATGMINHPWQSIIWNSISGIWFKNIDWLLSIAIGQSIMMITSIITSKRKLIAIECYRSTMIDKYSTTISSTVLAGVFARISLKLVS